MKEVLGAFKEKFGVSTLEEACSRLSGLEKKVLLMTLHVLLPYLPILNLSNDEKFQTLEGLQTYLKALITSGVAEDEADKLRGVIYILGQSESGKTSFVKTIKAYIENPTDQPKAMFTIKNIDMHTQILETSDVKVVNRRERSFSLKPIRGSNNSSKLISFTEVHTGKEGCDKEGSENAIKKGTRRKVVEYFKSKFSVGNISPRDNNIGDDESNKQEIALKFVDYGGHEEYESCSSLFMSEGGTFAIMVDSNLLTCKETIEATYTCRVGSYIDRILESTSGGENKPKIQLVVTKVTPETDKNEIFGVLFEMTRKHLESKQGDSAYLVDRVMKSYHSDHLTRESLQDQYEKMISLSSDEQINPRPGKKNPADWFALRDKAKKMEVVTFDGLIDMLCEVERERVDTGSNNPPELLANLQKFSEVLKIAVKKPTTAQTTVYTPISKQVKQADKQTAEDEDSISTSSNNEVLISKPRSTETHTVWHESKIYSTDDVYRGKKQEMTTILTYLSQSKELLWFPEIEALQDLVIPNIETLIRSMRLVINHNPREHFTGIQMKKAKEDYEQTGVLAFKDFKTIYKKETEKEENKNQEFLDESTTWMMIENLGSGCPLDQEASKGKQLLFPYLAKKETKDAIAKKGKRRKGRKRSHLPGVYI